jgi:putative mycofactocin binding protein MftB
VSTEPEATFRPERPYRLSDHVVLRPEPFGGLAYDLQTRKLLVLRDPSLVALVQRLDEYPSARAAVSSLAAGKEPAAIKALASLERGGLIRAAG